MKRKALEVEVMLRRYRISFLVLFFISTACIGSTEKNSQESLRTALTPYVCVKMIATATPPNTLPPVPKRVDTNSEQEFSSSLKLVTPADCPKGQVPVVQAPQLSLGLPFKGNPLLGPIEKLPEGLKSLEDLGRLFRGHILQFEDVYGPHSKVPSQLNNCNGEVYDGFCYYYASAASHKIADGAGVVMTIERPADVNANGHSLNEAAVQGGERDGHIVEIGWNVSSHIYRDTYPHLFVFHWVNWTPSCYNSCGWQQYNKRYYPGMELNLLVGKQIYVGFVLYEGNWWAWLDNEWIGYFSGENWGHQYTSTSLIQWYGEVVADASLCDVSKKEWICWWRDDQALKPTFPTYYDLMKTGYGEFRYGGSGG